MQSYPDTELYMDRIVEVEFMDHVTALDAKTDLMRCTVWGRLVYQDDRKIRIRRWETDESKDAMVNAEYVTLIRSAVVNIQPLKYNLGEE